MWGNPRWLLPLGTADGSIPTCVGQPPLVDHLSSRYAVYPHVCGATQVHIGRLRDRQGLSPRVWGNQPIQHVGRIRHRSIPTCVGQPKTHNSNTPRPPVYPHVCGATQMEYADISVTKGLSPRVWGNLFFSSLPFIPPGSIPTCVGQPSPDTRPVRTREVYPHVCGATASDCGQGQPRWGLSPRVWGNRIHAVSAGRYPRSIPTCVGQPHR